MGAKARVPSRAFLARLFLSPFGKFLIATAALVVTLGLGTFLFFYIKYSRMIEEKLSGGPFIDTSMVFAAPRSLRLGDEVTVEEITAQLRRSGYSEARANRMGSFTVRGNTIEIYPGPDSFFMQEDGVVKLQDGRVSQIISLRDNTERTLYTLEPELITNLFDRNRDKRRLVRFEDIPKVLVNAVISAEDKRFFLHAGFDPLRILKAAYIDVKEGRHAQGASTLSMQLARMFWLSPERTWKRKIPETLITLHLEQKLSKQQIFEYYANQVPLGRRGSFNICGFGEASQAYFGKDISQLTLPEAATLAGLIQRPSFTNPLRWPERAQARRNVILALMRENGFINDHEYAVAAASPLTVARGAIESTDAPYFVDLVNDDLQERFQQHDFQADSYRVYTTLDLNLQREAAEAVRLGLKEIDERIQRRRRPGENYPDAQVALVALDPQTGDVKALIGGRNYGMSQLNRALAKRQPGSSFKPFVYAAALNSAVADPGHALTASTTVVDEPTTFWFDGKPYEPGNFKNEYRGVVTVRQALAKSMNIPTVKLAESVGYETVVELARGAGMNLNIQPTPAVALGAYEVTPLEIAGAYTVFANQGIYSKPQWIRSIRDKRGEIIYDGKPVQRAVLDPRIAYLMTNLMEEVLRTGTGAGVRSRGFVLPAAGKTGTSHDGWFAGFTTRLICVVWVGFDDNRELRLEGAHSALPIWTEFMKRAHEYREYRGARPFDAPDGIVSVEVDAVTGKLATSGCPSTRSEVFVAGTQPVEYCRLHGGGATRVAGWETPGETADGAAPAAERPRRSARLTTPEPPAASAPPPPAAPQKRGFFGRIRELFK